MEVVWIVTWAFAFLSLTGSATMLLATWRTRYKTPVRSLLQTNILASTFLCGVHLLVLSCFHLQGITVPNMKSSGLEYHRLNLCSIAAFVNSSGTVATAMFLFLSLVNISKEICQPLEGNGLSYLAVMISSVLTWLVSFVIAGSIYLPFSYFDAILRTMQADQCLILDSILHDDVTWHYSITVHVIIPGVLYLASLGILTITDIKARCTSSIMADYCGPELWQLWKIGTKGIVLFFSWCLVLCAVLLRYDGNLEQSSGAVKWLIFVGSTLHAVVVPFITLLTSGLRRCLKKNRHDYDEEFPGRIDTPIQTRKERVSVRLSQYIKDGGLLTPKEAVLVTSDIAESINALHKIGLIPANIDPDNIFIDQDMTGEILNTRLASVPFKPKSEALGNHILENKGAIAQLFDFLVRRVAQNQAADSTNMERNAVKFHSLREYRQKSVKSKFRTRSERNVQDFTIRTRSTSVRSRFSRKSFMSKRSDLSGQSRKSQKSQKSKKKKISSRRFYRTDVETLEKQLTVFKERRLSRTVAVDIADDEEVPGISETVLDEDVKIKRPKIQPRMSIQELELDRCYSEEWD